ncbi:MAG TPA: polysaccharide pyruvyl transferase family protein [Pseudogracilibacillus sp.]|nr:polysaccharide pyruvyl transferase family protein [Pseudogracilibacillus sp.]
MKHVALHAYPFGNVGDDLFIHTVCERYPEVQFHLSVQTAFTKGLKNIPNLTLHAADTTKAKLRRWVRKGAVLPQKTLGNIDAIVYIGGSLFMEQDGWKKSFLTMKLLHQTGKPFFVIGANFGPYTSEDFRMTHELFFNVVQSVSFRDRRSYNIFSHLENVSYAPDVVFQHRMSRENHLTRAGNHMLLSVIYPSVRKSLHDCDDTYFSAMARLIEQTLTENWQVTVSAFCPYEKDDQATGEIMNRVRHRRKKDVRMHTYDGDLEEVYTLFSQATHVVATRFHAMILGWLFEKCVLPISYSTKMDNVLADIDYNEPYPTVETVCQDVYKQVLARPATEIHLSPLATEAENHFKALDQLLNNE